MQTLVAGLLWFSAIACGLMAGLYFAFSAFVMAALGRVDQAAGIAVMNAINKVIVQSLFLPVFMGSTLTCLSLAVLATFRWHEPGASLWLAGGGVYLFGMFAVTMLFNLPLNKAPAAVQPASDEAGKLWARYLSDWTWWNHMRTIASTLAFVLFIGAIAAR